MFAGIATHSMTLLKGKCWARLLGLGKMELLHDMMKEGDCGQLKDLISDRSRWRQDSN